MPLFAELEITLDASSSLPDIGILIQDVETWPLITYQIRKSPGQKTQVDLRSYLLDNELEIGKRECQELLKLCIQKLEEYGLEVKPP